MGVDEITKWQAPKVLTDFSPHGLSGYDKEGSPGNILLPLCDNFDFRLKYIYFSDRRTVRRHGHVGLPSLHVPSRLYSRHNPESGALHAHRIRAEQDAWTFCPTVRHFVRHERFQFEAIHVATG